MSLSDIFYPDNPARRKKVISKMQQIYVLMEQNFKATDELITFLNEHISPSPNIAGISVDNDATLGKNAQTIIDKMKEIQEYVDKIDEDLSTQLETDVYKMLTDSNTDFDAKLDFFKTLQTTETLFKTIGGYLMLSRVFSVDSARFLEIIDGASEIVLSSFADVIAGVFVAGAAIAIESTISAILGAVEKDKLNGMIDELDAVLSKFEEPSLDYIQNIYEALGVLKYLLK